LSANLPIAGTADLLDAVEAAISEEVIPLSLVLEAVPEIGRLSGRPRPRPNGRIWSMRSAGSRP
jgi:hypothetical protein